MTWESNLKYWLALIRTPTLGSRYSLKLINKFAEISELFARKNMGRLEKLISEKALNYLTKPDWACVEQDLKWATQPQHHLMALDDPSYPFYLRQLPDPPLVLYIKGCADLLNTPQIALVGTRDPTFSGQETAFQFAYDLAKINITITSGLARGIDSSGHRGALAANGRTIAVLGSGIHHIYPKEHSKLAEKISEHGAIVSEFPLNTPPIAKHFPQRNRIISGLSQGVLVVEASMNSGSLLTARMANDQGREVFAIPGSIYNIRTQGCHHLIQEGARLVVTVNDILAELSHSDFHHHSQAKEQPHKAYIPPSLTEKEKKIWSLLSFEPVPIDFIILRSGLTIGEVSSILLSFEINSLIVSTPAGYLRK